MAIAQDIEVKVTLRPAEKTSSDRLYPEGEPLKEYPGPKPKFEYDGSLVEKYIEAVANQEFQIEIYFKPEFDMFDADDVQITLSIDYDTVSMGKMIPKYHIVHCSTTGVPLIFRDVYYLNDAGEHRKLSFSFGSLEGDENIDMEDDLADEQADKIGRIVVELNRQSSKKRRRAKTTRPQPPKPLDTLIFPAAVVKNRNVGHAMVPGSDTPSDPPNTRQEYDYTDYKEHGCKPALFCFRYRDDLALQKLGVIPKKNPSFPNMTSAQKNKEHASHRGAVKEEEGGDESETITTLRMENERLRAELAAAKSVNEGTPVIKQEEVNASSSQPSAETERPRKRQKVVIELD